MSAKFVAVLAKYIPGLPASLTKLNLDDPPGPSGGGTPLHGKEGSVETEEEAFASGDLGSARETSLELRPEIHDPETYFALSEVMGFVTHGLGP